MNDILDTVLGKAPAILDSITSNWQLSAVIAAMMVAATVYLFRDDKAVVQLAAFTIMGLLVLLTLFILIPQPQTPSTQSASTAGGQAGTIRTPSFDPKIGSIDCVRVVGLNETSGDGFLAVRQSHTAQSAQLNSVYNDEILYVHNRRSNWLEIKYHRDKVIEITGWVSRRYTMPDACPS